MERIAVIGAGLMGHGIAQVFAAGGHPVAITDTDPRVLATVPERVRSNLEQTGAGPALAGRIELHNELEGAIEDAALVIEAVFEDPELKQDVFSRMSAVVGAETILATNTSVIAVGEIGARARNQGRIVGTHWWYPPYLVPLVEVIQAERTDSETVERVMGLLRSVGKSPVHVKKDVPGFVGNRMQHALWREAMSIVDSGIADAEAVDHVVMQGFGMRLAALGPLAQADLIGLDLTLAIHEYLLPELEATPQPVGLLSSKVQSGDLGMKTGEGFHSWTEETAAAARKRVLDHLVGATAATSRTT